MPYADLPFVLAIAAIGFGLSLATYRLFASHYQWPMGEWHENRPALPILIGLAALALGTLFAVLRGMDPNAGYGGYAIGAFGLALAFLWTAFLRVGSQISIFLAPISAALLFVIWNFGPNALEYNTVRSEVRELRKQIETQFGLGRDGQANGTVAPRRTTP
jgi:hypothetical protein